MNRTAFYYDNRSNLKAVLDPDNGLTYYTHDALNRMTSVKNPWGEVTYYDYSPGGRLLRRRLGNGTMAYYSYDAVGQVRKVENVKSDLTVISSFEYERNALGSPLSILREDGSVTYYEYDPKQQLTKEMQLDSQGQQLYGWTWEYDPAGNRTRQEFNGVETTYEYNAANELTEETTAGATTYFEYDHNGNMTAKVDEDATTFFHWDRENLLTQVDLPNGGHSYFAYDADGKRVEKRDSEGYTRFVYQGPNMLALLQERDASNNLQAQYTMGNGLEAMRRGGASRFYHYDWLGSTFELTDEAEAVTDTYLYNAWGEVLSRIGTTMNPHCYGGAGRYYRLPDVRLCLLGHRYYDLSVGRFLAVDPMLAVFSAGATQSASAPWVGGYAYCHNRPGQLTDPLGLWDMDEVHLRKTIAWGGTVRVTRWGRVFAPTEEELWAMGEASRQVDVTYDPQMLLVAPAMYARWHFDWPDGSRSRENLYERLKQEAVRRGRGGTRSGCVQGATFLGKGLHPLQDIGSHDHVSPIEHILSGNWPFIDRTDYDVDWSASTQTSILTDPKVAGACALFGIAAGAQIVKLNYGRLEGRVFHWNVVDRDKNPRLMGTMNQTLAAITDWLANTCCGREVGR